jgi:hypothetical protein
MQILRCLVACATLLVLTHDLPAQVLRGRVVTAERATPIPGALVELQDSVGRPMQRALTSPSGTYRFVPGGQGRYRVRVAAIGYAIHPVTLITHGTEESVVPDFRLEATIAILPDLVAAGKRRMCGREILEDPLLGRLLEGAKASLALMEQSIGLGTRFSVEEIRTRTITAARRPEIIADTLMGELTKWPLESVRPEVLQREGFARILDPSEGSGRVYYGPDLRVLFADWFLDSHCYAFEVNARDDQDDLIRVKYEPKEKSALVDVAGELMIDPTTLSLREFTFVHRNLPRHIKEGTVGGMVGFARLESGGWLPVRWEMYGPVEAALAGTRTTRVVRMGASRGLGTPMAGRAIQPTVLGKVRLIGRVVEGQ